MQSRIFSEDTSWFEADQEQLPIVLIAYENAAAAQKALQALRRIFSNVAEPITFRPILWSFDRLEAFHCRQHASEDASKADILVISANVRHPFSPAIIEWFADCVNAKQGQTAAVVTLFNSQGNEGATIKVDLLRRAATEAGLDFFAHNGAPLLDPAELSNSPIHSVSLPDRYWGLNE